MVNSVKCTNVQGNELMNNTHPKLRFESREFKLALG